MEYRAGALWFEWYDAKDETNRRKHDVDFVEACTIFGDPLAITRFDHTHSDDEDREVTLGVSGRNRLLVVVSTVRGDRIRLISARRATAAEQRSYERPD